MTRPKSPKVILDIQGVRGLSQPEGSRRDYWKQYFYSMDSSESIRIQTSELDKEASTTLIISELPVERVSARSFESYARFLASELQITRDESLMYKEQVDAILEFSMDAAGHQLAPALLPSSSNLPVRSFRQAELNSEFIPVQGRERKSRTLQRFSQLDSAGDIVQIIDAIRSLDGRVSDLRLSMPDGVMDIWARVNGTLLPLKAMGEGVNRICHILVTMLSDLDYLFLDEIENGIHHSAHVKVWHAIGQVARELDIQVFATTHSLEMIRAAYQSFKECGALEDLRLHRLDRDADTGDIEAVTYNRRGLEALATFDFDFEVRG